MLSKSCKIAIKAVVYLCSRSDGDNAGIKQIASYIGASEHTVGKILQALVKERVIRSIKGPSGGFFMTDMQKRQPIIRIVEAVDGHELFTGCGLGLPRCSAAHPCPIHKEYKAVRDALDKLFRENSVKTLCEPVSEGLAYLMG